MTAPKMIKGIVATGRSLMAGGAPLSYPGAGAVGPNEGSRQYLPGEEVELPEAEYLDAVKHGFLVDPDAPPAPDYSRAGVQRYDDAGQPIGRVVDRPDDDWWRAGRLPDAPR